MVRLLSTLAASLFAVSVAAHDDDAGSKGAQKLGKVNFASSCSAKVQPKVQRAVAMLHSFWFPQGEREFQEIAEVDPDCAAIAAWGFASILMNNPFVGLVPPKEVERAQGAIAKGRQTGAKTQREKDYLEAVAAYWDDFAIRTQSDRALARSRAYQALALKYPKDDEAQIFNALYLIAIQQASDQTYSNSLKAATILEKQFAKYPGHPGVAHYLIHAYDAPPMAQKGVSAARRYASIAPDAPHALHMPSHIFTRVGAWPDSAATNRRSADVALKTKEGDDALHALDYVVYAYLQLARDSDARKSYEEAARISPSTPRFIGPYPLAAMPARLAIERGAWREAAQLQPLQSKFPFTEALTHQARAIGAARTGDAAAAKADVEKIAEKRDALRAAQNDYWATEVEVMRLGAAAWTALAEDRGDEALGLMRQAADMEDKNEKHPVTPGRLLPARELLGDMLMEMKRPADALKEYEQSQKREPDRFRGLYGAALAAEMAGEARSARRYYGRLVQIAGKGEPRAELQLARAYLSQ
ncbi:MAG: tetratricopeptide repeat protein [Burkholderiales bacterium]